VPCGIGLERIVSGDLPDAGVLHPVEWLSDAMWLDELRRHGARVLHRLDADPTSGALRAR
jgi:hypothetical protein